MRGCVAASLFKGSFTAALFFAAALGIAEEVRAGEPVKVIRRSSRFPLKVSVGEENVNGMELEYYDRATWKVYGPFKITGVGTKKVARILFRAPGEGDWPLRSVVISSSGKRAERTASPDDYEILAIYDATSATLKLHPPEFQGGLRGGSEITLRWDADDENPGGDKSAVISFIASDGKTTALAEQFPFLGSAKVTVPTDAGLSADGDTCVVRIKVTDQVGNVASAEQVLTAGSAASVAAVESAGPTEDAGGEEVAGTGEVLDETAVFDEAELIRDLLGEAEEPVASPEKPVPVTASPATASTLPTLAEKTPGAAAPAVETAVDDIEALAESILPEDILGDVIPETAGKPVVPAPVVAPSPAVEKPKPVTAAPTAVEKIEPPAVTSVPAPPEAKTEVPSSDTRNGLLALFAGKPSSAVSLLSAQCSRRPNDAGLLIELAGALVTMGKTEEAEARLSKSYKRFSVDFDYLCELGKLRLDLRRITAAGEVLNRAARLRPDEPRIIWLLARLRAQESRPEDARILLRRLLEVADPDSQLFRKARRYLRAFVESGD